MKWYQKFLIGILFFSLINLISILIISCNIKKVLVDGIIKETIKTQIISRVENEGNFTVSEEQIAELTDDERVQEILNSKEVQDLIDKYLDITINGMTDEESLNEIDLEKDMLNYLKDNKEVLSEIVGEEVTDELIDETASQLESKDMSKALKQTITNSRNSLTETEVTILRGYVLLVSWEFKLSLLMFILLDLLLIAIIQKSVTKWIKVLGEALATSGILVLIMALVVKIIVSSISGFTIFNVKSLVIPSLIVIGVGFIIIILYSIILRKKDDGNVIT